MEGRDRNNERDGSGTRERNMREEGKKGEKE